MNSRSSGEKRSDRVDISPDDISFEYARSSGGSRRESSEPIDVEWHEVRTNDDELRKRAAAGRKMLERRGYFLMG